MAGVFDFDEDHIEPFPSKSALKNRTHVSRPVKDAERKSCSTACRKQRGKKISGKNLDENIDTLSCSQSVLKASRCNVSHGSTMTQSFESSSKDEVIEQPVKIQGCCLEVLSVSPYAKEERLSEVTVGGEDLLFAKGTIQMHSLEFTFTTSFIALKLLDDNQHCSAINWLLDEITGFSFRTCQQTNDNMLELILTESGMKLLEHKLGSLLCKSDILCDKGYTLATKIKSPYQSDLERRITSLCDRYKVLWRPGQIKRNEQMSLKQDLQEWKGSEHHLFGKGEPNERVISKGLEVNMTAWFDLTYPKGDPDAVTITMDDFFLLNPNEFVSDTIIDFYIKYLQSRLPEHEKKGLYFFNSFFFRKLANLDRDIAHGSEKTSSLFEHMKRWTRDINIFEKDFLFIPIIQSAHWSLVIVCHPKCLFNHEHGKFYKETLILHFDSMEGFHKGVEETIKKYLVQHLLSTGTSENDKSCKVKCILAKVPQQTNYSDCGLFMLHYVEMFLTALQSGLSKIVVSRDWFNPEDVASKRSMLQRLIKEIQKEELAEKVVVKHVDTPLEEPIHGTISMEDVSKLDLSEGKVSKTDAGSTQKAHSSCHSDLLQIVDHDSHELDCCQFTHAVCGSHHGKASDASRPGAVIKTFDEEKASEPSNTPYMEDMHPTYLSAGKDARYIINISEDFDVSRHELNKMHMGNQSEGLTSNAKEPKNNEIDEIHVSTHTINTTPEVDEEEDDESNHLMFCDQGATQGSRRKCLPFKEQQSLLQANNHIVSRDSDLEDDFIATGVSKQATHMKGNFVNKRDHTQDQEQEHSDRASFHHAHDPTCQSLQVYISSDEESGCVKVQKIVEAAKLRQQNKRRKAEGSKGVLAPIASNASKGIENQPPKARWRLLRKSQLRFL